MQKTADAKDRDCKKLFQWIKLVYRLKNQDKIFLSDNIELLK